MNSTNQPKRTCPVCGKGTLVPTKELDQIRYRETPIEVWLRYSECDNCGTEITSAEEAKVNDFAIRERYKLVQKLLSGQQVKAIRSNLNLTQREASEVFGGGANSFAKYETERVVQSKSLDLLLRLANERPEILKTLKGLENRVEEFATLEFANATCLKALVKKPAFVTVLGSGFNVLITFVAAAGVPKDKEIIFSPARAVTSKTSDPKQPAPKTHANSFVVLQEP